MKRYALLSPFGDNRPVQLNTKPFTLDLLIMNKAISRASIEGNVDVKCRDSKGMRTQVVEKNFLRQSRLSLWNLELL